MALAARSSADPRTACPVCGGSIHPIAGKCKHCKSDLVKLRRHQQAATGTPPPARLPYGAPARPPTAPAVPVPAPMNGSHSAPVAAAPVIISAPVAAIDPFALSDPPPPRGAWSRSWPIVVAVIAAGAIVVSVILLLTGGNGRDHKLDHVVQSPAPDHMDTNPDLPSDPWQGANPGSGGASGNTMPAPVDPSQGVPVPPPPPSAPTPGQPISAPPPEQLTAAMFQALCARFTTCGVLDASGKSQCEEFAKMIQASNPDIKDQIASGQCTYDRDKASACLTALSELPCDKGQGADIGQISQLLGSVSDCSDALACH
jgi:hypothetical protein